MTPRAKQTDADRAIRSGGAPPGRASVFHEPGYARRYDEDRYGGGFGRWLRRWETDRFREMIGEGRREVLDAGGGTGKLGLGLSDAAGSTTVCDVSLPMLRRCRTRARASEVELRMVAADLEALPFGDRAFEVVVCSRVLMHLDDWKAGLADLCRVARRQLVLDFPATGSVAGIDSFVKRAFGRGKEGPRAAYRTFRVSEVRHQLERQGFVVERTDRSFALPHFLHRRLDRPDLSRAMEAWLARSGLARVLGSPVTMKAARRDQKVGDPTIRHTSSGRTGT